MVPAQQYLFSDYTPPSLEEEIAVTPTPLTGDLLRLCHAAEATGGVRDMAGV